MNKRTRVANRLPMYCGLGEGQKPTFVLRKARAQTLETVFILGPAWSSIVGRGNAHAKDAATEANHSSLRGDWRRRL